MSVELNAHNLLYIVCSVKQQHLPKQALTNIHLFNSQSCESIFRDARSLSGTFSTMVNFSVKSFIRRSQKLSVLNELKHNQLEENLRFPVHHKHKRENLVKLSHQPDDIDISDIEQIISEAYDQAIDMMKDSTVLNELSECNIESFNDLSQFTFEEMNRRSRMTNLSSQTWNDLTEEPESDEDDDDDSIEDHTIDQTTDEDSSDNQSDDSSDEEAVLNSTKSTFEGIRIRDHINPSLENSYFKIKLNDKSKYLHKQSACWLLSNNITKLSSDRLSRVVQQTTRVARNDDDTDD